jgi:glycosyltransferase involved in cell wall biosynthesis
LFVGGDFERKGGESLLRCFDRLAGAAELTLVTEAEVPPREGIRVVSGARPGSEQLMRAYADADIFCLPTRGDCTPVVLAEAMAAALPVVTTRVGSNSEVVACGETGLLVAPDDDDALMEALERLVRHPKERRAMGLAARQLARERMDADANGRRIGDLLVELGA